MSAPAPPKPVHLTQAQKNLIRATPIHRQIKHCVYSVLAVSALGCLVTLAVTVSSCVAARSLIDDHRWLIFHYVMASLFACLWLAFAGIYYRDVKFGAWSDQLKLDGAWLSVGTFLFDSVDRNVLKLGDLSLSLLFRARSFSTCSTSCERSQHWNHSGNIGEYETHATDGTTD